MKSIYFSHPIKTYATPESLQVLTALKQRYPNYKVIDPEDLTPPIRWRSCRQCMDEGMKKIFFPSIEQCEKFFIWSPIITCGISCELFRAWELGKEVIYISYQSGEVDFEAISLNNFHYIRVGIEVS